MPLVNAQKGAQKTTQYQKKPRDGAEQERARRKHCGGGKETRNWRHNSPRDRQGPGRWSRLAGGSSGSRNVGRRTEPRQDNPQGLTVTPPCQGQRKGGDHTGEEAVDTGLRRGDADAGRGLGIR